MMYDYTYTLYFYSENKKQWIPIMGSNSKKDVENMKTAYQKRWENPRLKIGKSVYPHFK